MKAILFSMGLLLLPSLFAQENDADRMELRLFVQDLILEQVSIATTETLLAKSFSQAEVDQVLQSREFQVFSRQIVSDSQLIASIDRLVERFTQPSLQEREQKTLEAKNIATRQLQLAIFLTEALRDRELRMKEPNLARSAGTFWERIRARFNILMGG